MKTDTNELFLTLCGKAFDSVGAATRKDCTPYVFKLKKMERNVLSKVIPSQDSHLVHVLFALIASNPNRFHLRQLYSMCKPTMKRIKFKNKINTLKMFISAKTHCVVAVITRVITSKYAFSADEFYACSFANSTRHNNFLMYSCNSEFYGLEIFFPLFFEMILVKGKLYFLPPTKTPYFL